MKIKSGLEEHSEDLDSDITLIRESELGNYFRDQFEDSRLYKQMGNLAHYIDWERYGEERAADSLEVIELPNTNYYYLASGKRNF